MLLRSPTMMGPCRRICILFFLLRSSLQGALAGVDDGANRQVLVKEVVLDSAIVDIVYLGVNHECLLVTTKSKRLYFSEDSGQSWNEITGKIDTGSIQVERIIVSPSQKTIAVLQTIRQAPEGDTKHLPMIYVTEDSGRTWRRTWGQRMHSWIFHATEKNWAIVSYWSGGCDTEGTRAAADGPCSHTLMVTRDLGRTFTTIVTYAVQFSWGSVKAGQANRIYFTAYKEKTGDQGRLSLWTREVDFSYIVLDSSGRPRGSITLCVEHGNKFLISNEFIMVAKVRSEQEQTVWLMVSSDGAKTFNPALLPSGMGELEEKWYTVLDTSEGAVILHINSDSGMKDTGRIFISDEKGYKYSQSLMDNVRSSQGECEFDRITSLTGVYMANIVVPESSVSRSYKEEAMAKASEIEEDANEGTSIEKKHGRGGKRAVKPSKEERTIRTVVSFDKGGVWTYLKAPRVDSLGKPFGCEGRPAEECSLHLHGTTSWDFYAPFYSSETAVGIIMGTGNVGSSLRFEPDNTNTYLSRDGGLTWVEAHKGAYIYEFGDHGGLIVMADDLRKTTQVVFTWNEGQSWFDFTVSNVPFEVDNILTEPNVTSTTFIMFGTREGGEGVLYYMRFDALNFGVCRGVWAADSVSSDYETWSPSDGINAEKCLLGQQVVYTRRKRTSQCWNGEKFKRPSEVKKCQCTKEDFACEIGFVRSVGSQECIYGGTDMMPTKFVPEVCSGTFPAKAYRKVPGDVCEGGFQPLDVDVPCPSSDIVRSSTGFLMKYGVYAAMASAALYVAHSFFGGAGQKDHFSVSAKGGWTESASFQALLSVWLFISGIGSMFSKHRGFETFGGYRYKKVDGNEFDLDVGNQESLSEFIDEAEQDDYAPRVYDSMESERRRQRPRKDIEKAEDELTTLSGGLRLATEEVPKLQAPPATSSGSQAQRFDIGGSTDDDLL